jgi:hypothetical protein
MSAAIKQMVQFIEQEAMEKCEEIAMKANEEFEQEKNRIKMEEKVSLCVYVRACLFVCVFVCVHVHVHVHMSVCACVCV